MEREREREREKKKGREREKERERDREKEREKGCMAFVKFSNYFLNPINEKCKTKCFQWISY